jgi:hypothetical protein
MFDASVPQPFPQALIAPPWPREQGTEAGPPPARQACHLVVLATAAAFAIPVGELTAATRRSGYVAFARQSAMYLAHVAFGLSYSEIGRAFGRDRTTAAHACKLIEDRRDDPVIDGVLGSLETVCGGLRQRIGTAVRR